MTALVTADGTVTGASGDVLAPSHAQRGAATSREVVGAFEVTAAATIVASGGIGGNHDLVRRQSAGTSRHASRAHDHRGPRLRRRVDAARHRGGGASDQRRPHVALRRRHPELGSDLAAARHPHSSRTVVDLAGCHRLAPARAAVPGFDTLGTLAHLRQTGVQPLVVRAVAEDHREGVHALGQRAEPRPHRQRRGVARPLAPRQGRRGAGAGLPRPRGRLRRAADPRRAHRRHARPPRRRRARRRARAARGRGARPRDEQRVHERRADRDAALGARLPGGTSSSARPRRIASSTPQTARSSR